MRRCLSSATARRLPRHARADVRRDALHRGDAREGLKLASRALDSGWFDSASMKPMGKVAETWRILMLLDLGELAEARARLAAAPSLPTAALAVDACDERWSDVVDRALRTLDDADFPPAGRPNVALLGRHAARQIEHEALARFRSRAQRRAAPGADEKEPYLSKVPLSRRALVSPCARGRTGGQSRE